MQVTGETELAELCTEDYAQLVTYFGDLRARNLKGKTEKGWEEFVRDKKGPDGLVSGWFKEHDLRPFLDVNVDSQNTPKKAKGEEGESGVSSSPVGEVPNLYAELTKCNMKPGTLVSAPDGFDWPCGLAKAKNCLSANAILCFSMLLWLR